MITFFVLKGLTTSRIHTEVVEVLTESAPSFCVLQTWANGSKSGTIPVIIQNVDDMVLMDDHRVKARDFSGAVDISKERIGYVLNDELQIKKLYSKRRFITVGETDITTIHQNKNYSQNNGLKVIKELQRR